MEMFSYFGFKGLYLGNLLASLIGMVFTIGAPIPTTQLKQRFWWTIFWFFLILYYTSQLLIALLTSGTPISIGLHSLLRSLTIVLSDSASIGLVVVYLSFYKKQTLRVRSVLLAALPLFIFTWVIEIAVDSNLFGQALSCVLFMLIAWSQREKSITSALILVAYATLQIPLQALGAVQQEFVEKGFALVLALKLSLIGAIYTILEAKPKGKLQDGVST